MISMVARSRCRWLEAVLVGCVVLTSPPDVVRGQGVAPASAPTASEADVLALRERAAAFWAARVAGDVQAQWHLLEPRWKGRMTAQEYGSDLTGGRYLAYQVEAATVDGLFATVKVRVLVRQELPPAAAARRLPPQVAIVDDGWIRIGGVWYRRLDEVGKTPSQARQP
jgi:hypothetical protein